MYSFRYGTSSESKDITHLVYLKCVKENILFIPKGDCPRAEIFGDPLIGVVKSIFVILNNDMQEYTQEKYICIDLLANKFITDIPQEYLFLHDKHQRLNNIHSNLKLEFGSFRDEYPEQLMVSKYIKGTEKVLEIGGNIGRNTMVIAHILNKMGNNNFVSLESDSNSAAQLEHNKKLNNLDFNIEASALSKRKLIQRGWETIPSESLLNGYTWVNTIDYDTLVKKYNIVFDTLVADCEGALYYILQDMPEMLNNINLIIMENDYHNIEHKNKVNEILINNGFRLDYKEAGGWGPCYNNFFEVWIKL